MTEGSLLRRIRGRVFPNQPDFYGLLTAQSAFAVSTLSLLVDYLAEGDADVGRAVKHSEEHARRLRDRSMAALNDAFSTPIDREDLYRAIASLHRLVTYARTTVREMEVLEVAPDPHSLRLGSFLHDGATAVDAGYGKLGARPADAAADADAARAAERHVEKAYRLALAELFDTGRLTGGGIDEVMEVFKRREIYRHLSNAGDRVAHAGEILHDIVVKLV